MLSGLVLPMMLKHMMLKNEQTKSIMLHLSKGIYTSTNKLNINFVMR